MPFLTDSNPPSYNGYTFPESVETVQFDQEPVFDEADRTIIYVKYRIGLQWYISAAVGGDIDSTIAALRATLMQRGKVFSYQDRGFGADFEVGPGGNYEDVRGGPKPMFFSFKPKGKNQGCRLVWTIELNLPSHCSYSVFGRLMTMNFKVKHSYDAHGYLTVTRTGFFAIPKLEDYHDIFTAYDYRDEAYWPVSTYCKRTVREFDYSHDKTRCDFLLVDKQLMPDAMLPEGCTDAVASHELGSDLERGFMLWDGAISGRYTLAPGYTIETAWKAFRDLLKHRIDLIRISLENGFNGNEKIDEQKPGQKPRVMLTGLKISEPDIYQSRTASFTATYGQVSSLQAVVGSDRLGTGMFKFPLTGSAAWEKWRDSLNYTNGINGNLQFNMDPSNEVIINLCDASTPILSSGGEIIEGETTPAIGDVTDLQPDPDEETSWFLYESEIECYEDNHAIVSSNLADLWNPYEGSPGDLLDKGYRPDPNKGDPTDSVQYRAPSTLYVYLSGHAMRAWFPIHRPKIISYGGYTLREISTEADGCYFMQKNMGSLGVGIPIYYAKWRLKYVIIDRPAEPIRPPVNLSEQN